MQTLKLTIVAFIALSLASCVSSSKYHTTAAREKSWELRYNSLSQDYDELQNWDTSWEGRYLSLEANYKKLTAERAAITKAAINNPLPAVSVCRVNNNALNAEACTIEDSQPQEDAKIGSLLMQKEDLTVAVQK